MKKKYLFLFVLLPFLSLGQKVKYEIRKGQLIKSTEEVIGNPPTFQEYGDAYDVTVTLMREHTFLMQAKVSTGDNTVGFLLVHDKVVENTYQESNGAFTLVDSEVVSDDPKIGSTCLFGLGYLGIFMIGFMFDNRRATLSRWIKERKIRFPFWQLVARFTALFLYWCLIPGFIQMYGGGEPTLFFGMTMPWVLAALLTVISVITLIVKHVSLMVDFKFEMKPYSV